MSTDVHAAGSSLATPVRGWRLLVGDWLLVGFTTAICQGVGIVTSLLFRMLLGPAEMGIFSALKLFISYSNYANLGISKGAAREFNIALGRGDTRTARHGLDLAFTVNTLSSVVYAAVLFGVAAWIALTGGGVWAKAWALGLVAVGVMALLNRYVTFQVTILRTSQAFTVTSRVSVLETLLTLSVCGLATWLWGLPGLLAGTLAVTAVSMAYLRRYATTSFQWAWDAAEIRRLIGIGGPILLAGAVSTLLRSLDKLMILAMMPDCEFQLGCYSVALLASGQLFGLGNMMTTVSGPRFGEKYGQSGDRRTVAELAARTSELLAAATALPAALALVLAPPLLARMLPDYQAGLAPTMWLVPGAVAMILALPGSQYLVAVERQRRAMIGVMIAVVVGAAANFVAIRAGWGLTGVAATTAVGYVVYFLFVSAIPLGSELGAATAGRHLAMLALLIGPTLTAALLLPSVWPEALAVQSIAVVGAWAASLALGWHRGGWRKALQGRRVPGGTTASQGKLEAM